MSELLPEPEPKDDKDRKLLADVKAYGLHVLFITPENNTPGWAFSVGLHRTRGSPEVIVFGLPQDVSHFVINELGRRALNQTLAAEQLHDGLIEGHPCVLKPVLPVWYRHFVGYAGWYYRHRPFPLLQCIWPDHDNRFPWDPLFRSSWLWAQPLLFHQTASEARAESLLASMAPSEPAG